MSRLHSKMSNVEEIPVSSVGTLASGSAVKEGEAAKRGWLRFLLVFLGVLQVTSSAGFLLGWQSVVLILKRERTYSFLCEDEATQAKPQTRSGLSQWLFSTRGTNLQRWLQADDGDTATCNALDIRMNYLMTISMVLQNVAGLPIGLLIDHIGPKWMWIFQAITSLGAFLMAYAEPADGKADVFFLGLVLVSLAGGTMISVHYHFGHLFPGHESMIAAMMTTCYSLSSVIPAILERFSNIGYSRRELLIGYGVLVALFVPFFAVLPSRRFVPGEDAVFRVASWASFGFCGVRVGGSAPLSERKQSFESHLSRWHRSKAWGKRVLSYFLNADYLWTLVFFPLWFMTFIFYLSSVSMQLEGLGKRIYGKSTDVEWKWRHTVDTLSTMYTWLMPLGSIGAVCTGLIADKFSFVAAFLLSTTLAISHLVLSMIPVLWLQPLTFVVFTLGQESTFAACFTFVDAAVSRTDCNALLGTLLLVGGLLQFIINPVVDALTNHLDPRYAFLPLSGALLCYGLLSYAYIWRVYRNYGFGNPVSHNEAIKVAAVKGAEDVESGYSKLAASSPT